MTGKNTQKDFEALSPVLELIYGLVKNMDSYLQVYAEDIKVDYLKQYKDVKEALQHLVQVLEQVFGLAAPSMGAKEDGGATTPVAHTHTGEVAQGQVVGNVQPAGQVPSDRAVSGQPQQSTANVLEPVATEAPPELEPNLPPLEEKTVDEPTVESPQDVGAAPSSINVTQPQPMSASTERPSQAPQQPPFGQTGASANTSTPDAALAGQAVSTPSAPASPSQPAASGPVVGDGQTQQAPPAPNEQAAPAAAPTPATPTGNPDDDPELKAILNELKNIQGQQK